MLLLKGFLFGIFDIITNIYKLQNVTILSERKVLKEVIIISASFFFVELANAALGLGIVLVLSLYLKKTYSILLFISSFLLFIKAFKIYKHNAHALIFEENQINNIKIILKKTLNILIKPSQLYTFFSVFIVFKAFPINYSDIIPIFSGITLIYILFWVVITLNIYKAKYKIKPLNTQKLQRFGSFICMFVSLYGLIQLISSYPK